MEFIVIERSVTRCAVNSIEFGIDSKRNPNECGHALKPNRSDLSFLRDGLSQ
jgi:hypothetical protein